MPEEFSSQSEEPLINPPLCLSVAPSLKSVSIISLLGWAKQNRIELVCKVATTQKVGKQKPEYEQVWGPPVTQDRSLGGAGTTCLGSTVGMILLIFPTVVGACDQLLAPGPQEPLQLWSYSHTKTV